jgi:LacI family transcriptional regulator
VKTRRVGVHEIARRAGVSPSAVSSFLRSEDGKGRVGEKSRFNILKACRELGYEPRQSAAFNRIYPELGEYCFLLSSDANLSFRNPFYAQLIEGLTDAIPAHDSHLHFCQFEAETNYFEQPERVPAPVRNGNATKLLCAGKPNLSLLEMLRQQRLPVVYLGQEVPLGGITCLMPDFQGGAHSALRHLITHGHRRIAVAAGPFASGSSNIIEQRTAFERAMKESGIPVHPEHVYYARLDTDGGKEIVDSLLQSRERPTALYCFNDMMAIGAIQQAAVRGLRIPEDLSIIGFDDIWLSGSTTPPLTTVHSPIKELAARGIVELDELTRNPALLSGPPRKIVLPTRLVERASVASLPAAASQADDST